MSRHEKEIYRAEIMEVTYTSNDRYLHQKICAEYENLKSDGWEFVMGWQVDFVTAKRMYMRRLNASNEQGESR